MMKALLEFSKIGDKVFFKGTPKCAEVWTEFLTSRPMITASRVMRRLRSDLTSGPLLKYLKSTKANFEDYGVRFTLCVVSFQGWMECCVKEGKWGSNDDNEQKGDDSKDEDTDYTVNTTMMPLYLRH